MPPRETLVTTTSRPNSEALATRVMLADPYITFHPYTYEFCRSAAAVIGYDDIKVVTETTTMRRRP
jgi:hypothetical protein